MSDNFSNRLQAVAEVTEVMLDRLLSTSPRPDESVRPDRLLAAMRYATLAGGKRIRPFLLVESAGLFAVSDDAVLQAAAALECVHCYSLVHDDLPAMDDDDLRRGRPTVHRAFDEATAVLAGDALLTLAFDVLADLNVDPDIRIALIGGLARAAGVGGMAGGQMLDIDAEGKPQSKAGILTLQSMKTGALIRFACEAGAILGRANDEDRARLVEFGQTIGRAFQLADDLLDATAETSAAGKRTAKDMDKGKATLVAIHGVARTRDHLAETTTVAIELLAPFGDRGDRLADAARFIASREN